MKERPILFSAPMVRAILSGDKTQTRRVVKPQPANFQELSQDAGSSSGYSWIHDLYDDYPIPSAYGQPGDRLWVRETFRLFDASIECGCSESPCECPPSGAPIYKATQDDGESRWKPSIFMPRSVCRITLEVKSVRVERLQDISEEDAVAEGIEAMACGVDLYRDYLNGDDRACAAIPSYASLWESINGPGSWDANPWVWVVEFKRIEQEAGE